MKALSLAVIHGQTSATQADQQHLLTPAPFPEVVARPEGQVWVGLHFPSLSLDVCQFDGSLPAVVIDQSGSRQTVHSACAVAQDYGITPGLSLNAAHALCRNLDVRLRDPSAEYRQLKRYGEQLLCFTPSITLGLWRTAAENVKWHKSHASQSVKGPQDNADSLLLEVSSSLRLYQGLQALLEKIRAEFKAAVSMQPVFSVAPGPSAALLMARNGMEQIVQDAASLRSVLGGVSLAGVDLPVTMVEKLMRCGLRNLRDCWRLPREDLGRRFGTDILHYLDRICGEQLEPMDAIEAPLCFRQRIELPMETRQHHLIVMAVEKLLDEVHRFLQMHNAATENIQIDLWHVNRASRAGEDGGRSRTSLVVQTAQADRRPERFLPQLGEQLERLVVEEEVNAVSVMVKQVLPYARSSEDLFERRDHQQQDFSQLVDVLCARLGKEHIYTLSMASDHRPEFAWQRSPLMGQASAKPLRQKQNKEENSNQPIAGYVSNTLPTRPLWLLSQPRPIQYTDTPTPELSERIEAGWWMRADIRREYVVTPAMSAASGNHQPAAYRQQQWLYRDLKQADQPAWYVHGLFA